MWHTCQYGPCSKLEVHARAIHMGELTPRRMYPLLTAFRCTRMFIILIKKSDEMVKREKKAADNKGK
jgi:hypothetical protein